MRKWMIIPLAMIGVFACGCSSLGTGGGQVMDGDGMFQIFEYKQISQDEAKEMMEKDDGHVIVDVRRQDEYDEGHIPGAILIPNESIEDTPPAELPDFDQIILVYCRSGRRSKEAAQKLADLGYSQVYEFGGIIDWTGEVVKPDAGSNAEEDDMTPMPIIEVRVGDSFFTIDLEDNSSSKAFLEKIKKDNLVVDMHDYGGFEKLEICRGSFRRMMRRLLRSRGI